MVHLDTIGTKDVTKKLDHGAVELTFLKLQVEVVLPELLEDLRHVAAIFSQVPGVDQNVVNIHEDEPMGELPEPLIHKPLEDGW